VETQKKKNSQIHNESHSVSTEKEGVPILNERERAACGKKGSTDYSRGDGVENCSNGNERREFKRSR
jgi:hypothetical protein